MNRIIKKQLITSIVTFLTNVVLCLQYSYKIKLFTCCYSSTTPNDSLIENQWAVEQVELNKAWDIYTGSSNIRVGVIDSGINGEHEDLSGNVNSNLSTQFGNYYSTGLTDSVGHGTNVAGIIGAVGNNQTGISGACWDVDLVSLRIATYSSATIHMPGILDAIEYANNANYSIPFLNMSVGVSLQSLATFVNDPYEFTNDFIDISSSYDGLLICAAGNGSNFGVVNGKNIGLLDNYILPASYSPFVSNMIVVGNSDQNDEKAITSNYSSSKVHLFAPGENIITTNGNGTYNTTSGTSFSAPLVAGVAALLKSIDPTLTTSQIKAAILNNVDEVNLLSNYCSTGGRLNAYKAALSILPELVSNDIGITFNSNTSYQKFLKMNCSSGHYSLLIDSSVPCRVTLYRKYQSSPLIQETFLTSGLNTINFLSETSQIIYLRVANLGSDNGNITLTSTYQNHSFYNSYSYQNINYHRAYCSCGAYVLMPHLLYVDNPFSNTGTCALCSAIVPLSNNSIILNNRNMSNSTPFQVLDRSIIQCY